MKQASGIWRGNELGEILGPGEDFWSHAHFGGICNSVDTVCIQRVPKTELKHTHLGSKILKEISKDRKIERSRGRSKTRTIQYTVSWKPRAQNFKRERIIFIKWYRQLEIKDNGVQEAPEASRVLFILSHQPYPYWKKKRNPKKVENELKIIFSLFFQSSPSFLWWGETLLYFSTEPAGTLAADTRRCRNLWEFPRIYQVRQKKGEEVRVTQAFQVGFWDKL